MGMRYKKSDFGVIRDTGDKRIAYILRTKDRRVEANIFWEPDNVQMRGIVVNPRTGDIIHSFGAAYPFVNRHGQGVLPKPDQFIESVIRKLKRGEWR